MMITIMKMKEDDDHHDDDDKGDDHDDDSDDNYHRSTLYSTKAAHDCHQNYHRSALWITNAAESEIMTIIRIIMIRITTVMISIDDGADEDESLVMLMPSASQIG